MADVFISFVHEDEQVAHAVQSFLRDQLGRVLGLGEVQVFLSSDEWQILAGENWLDRIFRELRESRVLVSLMSPTSVSRPWVNFEAGAAWVAGKPVVPVCFGGQGRDQLPKPYSVLQAVSLPDDGYYLMRSVAHHLSRNCLVPPPFFRDSPELEDVRRALEHYRAGA
jgi:hypothetical protein